MSVLILGTLPLTLPAQAAQTGSNPITGTWTGDLARDATSRMRISIELKLDGTTFAGVLTSPGLAPGDITGGTYDPRTRAVSFVVAVRGGDTKVRFDGTLQRDTIAGDVSSANISGTFKIARSAAGAATVPATPSAESMRAALRAGFTQVNDLISRAMDVVPVDKYNYRPVPSARTFGQVVGHVADSYQYHCGRAVRGSEAQRSDAIEKGPTNRTALVQKLRFAIDMCVSAHVDGEIGPLLENIAQANVQYGALVTYIRMLGLNPPGS